MNENINLVEILRDCPKGLRLYSPIYGDVDYSGINEGHKYPIVVTLATGNTSQFSSRGRVSEEYPQAECTLFPSKEMRDWRKFFKKGHIFKPFDMVLVRDDDGDIWKCEFFSHYNVYSYGCINNFYKQCISYKGNEHLLGTKISPEHE